MKPVAAIEAEPGVFGQRRPPRLPRRDEQPSYGLRREPGRGPHRVEESLLIAGGPGHQLRAQAAGGPDQGIQELGPRIRVSRKSCCEVGPCCSTTKSQCWSLITSMALLSPVAWSITAKFGSATEPVRMVSPPERARATRVPGRSLV